MIRINDIHGKALHEIDAPSILVAIAQLVTQGADLTGAYLTRADLTGAYLTRANLTRANLAGAYLAGANLTRANLTGAYLAGAYLAGANLAGADLTGAYLTGAYLTRANLTGANLTGAYLAGADLSGAYLTRAYGINAYRVTPLLMLLDQPGEIVAYKLVTNDGFGPYNGGITYEIGGEYAVTDADRDVTKQCGAGINLATLDWCMREWRTGFRILRAQFTAADIAAIPTATDGKFRVHRCAIVSEVDLVAIGLVTESQSEGEA